VRVYDLARELGVPNAQLIAILRELGVEVKSHSSTIDEATAQVVRELVREQQQGKQISQAEGAKKTVTLPPRPLPASDLAQRLAIDLGTLMRLLMSRGIVVAPHQPIELETVIRLVRELGYEFALEEAKKAVETTSPPTPTAPTDGAAATTELPTGKETVTETVTKKKRKKKRKKRRRRWNLLPLQKPSCPFTFNLVPLS
jgi:translation initiation factor IF-2